MIIEIWKRLTTQLSNGLTPLSFPNRNGQTRPDTHITQHSDGSVSVYIPSDGSNEYT